MKKIIYYLFLILPFIDLITSFTERIGQEWGGFIPGESLYNKLWNKYHNFQTIICSLAKLNKILFIC